MKKIQALMAAMLLPWLLSGCVLRTQGGESLETRVERLEKTTAETKATADQTKETLDRNVGSMAESSVYFENMRQEFAEMKGAFEENKFSQNKYTNDYQNLKAYLDQEFAKIDKRLQVLEDKAGIRTTDTYAALPADLGDVPVAKKSEKELFEEALLEFKKQRYTSSEKKFKDFLRQYAKSDKADAAKFYVGESLLNRKNTRMPSWSTTR
ncbi:MAG: hypothetical protein M5R36_00765 [Deltaproteobacteria bacterium]|nr:hypothetical protein [Deltaproteobacteria bacterium]